MPRGMNAPKLWPARALELQIGSCPRAGPSAPCFFVISLPVMVPTTRLTLRIGSSATTFSPRSIAGSQRSSSVVMSSDFSRP